MADDLKNKLAVSFGKSLELARGSNLPEAQPNPLTPTPPPVQIDVAMKRSTIELPVHLIERMAALQRRWAGERRKTTLQQMWVTALEEYLSRYEKL